jgi:hypothetical protein
MYNIKFTNVLFIFFQILICPKNWCDVEKSVIQNQEGGQANMEPVLLHYCAISFRILRET